MSSDYSSLSTKLSLKNSSVPEEDDTTFKYPKVSLTTEAEDSQDTARDTGSEYRWKNKFDGFLSTHRTQKSLPPILTLRVTECQTPTPASTPPLISQRLQHTT
ncbi:hypothetical protein KUCAC02_011266 [Chaenocephalus aceratus]|uniref:Uncharacterized protein n=1 Tax=Chaenocephalus aceratus TaxID=36190 RepID=A0ACB9WV67_CHAAC|nr:hypothetical protein KUCAC02_011266 [Chaenocephalus aceratus]